MNPNYPAVMFELETYLKECKLNMKNGQEDGRIGSVELEKIVVDKIAEKFESIKPPPRHWYDIALYDNDQIIYCNVKISTGNTDNANQKKAIIHSFTNVNEAKIKPNMNFNQMLRLINSDLLEVRNYHREYYYIYIDKTDGSIIIRSLCDIVNLQSNPCNYLQINWKKEKDVINNTDNNENIEFIEDIAKIRKHVLGTIAESIKKFVDGSSDFLEEFYNIKLAPKDAEE
jgi:hypothetical protein